MPHKPLKNPLLWTFLFSLFAAISFIMRIIIGREIETYLDALQWKLFSISGKVFLSLTGVCTLLSIAKYYRCKIYARLVSWIQRILLIVFSTLFALFVLEILLRIIEPPPPPALELRGLHRVSPYPGVLYDLIPGTSRTIDYGEEGRVQYRINHLGFRGSEYTLKKPTRAFRILAMGDSVSFGVHIPDHARYTEQLENLLNEHYGKKTGFRFEVLNISVGGWNTHNERAWLMARALDFQPDLILWQFHMNDVDDPIGEIGTTALCHFHTIPRDYFPNPHNPAINNNILVRRPEDVSFAEILNWYGGRYTRLFRKLYGLWRKFRGVKPGPNEGKLWLIWCLEYLVDEKSPQWQWLRRNFEMVKNFCEEHNLPVIVLVTPLAYQLNSTLPLYGKPIENVVQYFKELGFTVVNVTPELEARSKNDSYHFYRKDDASHFNPAGNRLIAGEIFKALEPHLEIMLKE